MEKVSEAAWIKGIRLRVRELREEKGWSRPTVVRLLDRIGIEIAPNTIKSLEDGTVEALDLRLLDGLARVLESPLPALIGLSAPQALPALVSRPAMQTPTPTTAQSLTPEWLAVLERKLREPGAPDVAVMIVGTIAAGEPIEALELPEGPIVVPAQMARRSGAYALRVRGSSMKEDHILDGDLVVIEAADQVDDGEIAVVLLDGSRATLKRVYPEPGRVRLQPANHEMPAMYVTELRVQGRVRGVIRWV